MNVCLPFSRDECGSGILLCAGWCWGPGSGWMCTCAATSGSLTPPTTGQRQSSAVVVQ